MPKSARKTLEQCREKISEIIGEAVVENNEARREGLLTLADLWIEVADRRQPSGAARPKGYCEP